MNLLFINNEFPPIGGGGSTVTKYAIKRLVASGHAVTLITSRYKDLPHREIIDGATVIRIPALRKYKDYSSMIELVSFGISALIYCFFFTMSNRVDFIFAFFAVPAGWVAWILSYIRAIPYGVYFGGSDIPNANPSRFARIYPFITPLLKAIWRRASFRSVCSEELRELAKASDPQSDFLSIPNGVETERFVPIGRPENPKVKILFIGRLIPRKGFHRVVRALPKVREMAKIPFEIEVVGTGLYREELDMLAEELGVSDLIRYVGMVPYDQLEKSYQYADIFVLTSLSEGMPSVILEAMGCGLPIIASNVGGNNEIVHEGQNGYLITGDAVDILAEKLSILINDKELRTQMGNKSREYALQYDWKNIMDKYNDLIEQYGKKQ
ncbi:MAG TPA: glycosyltransferase family 4 protein [Candidatus Andersenbacteria bacterium]|nr:glycosyltransferase family 4 protein [Candidatus Andersenbacteria bacterium]